MEQGSLDETKKQLEALSKVFGGAEEAKNTNQNSFGDMAGLLNMGGEDMAEKIAMAQKLSRMLSEKDKEKHKSIGDIPLKTTGNRQVDILMAALPFIEPGLQKPLSIMVNFMEIKNILNRGMPLQIQNEQINSDPAERRKQLMNAILPYMDKQEQQKINGIMTALEMSKMMNIMGGNE